ncbi:hypothetical protein R70006_04930 [Paraburkholderia domus]|uniref:hypothetical protein n=1 Tax=Paraburkholderia domus TaxID=2793075 RepID=UPI0019130CDA|nr:hypothetical protein [Paraburkholderia domus]MBK5051831.1 hypothetical protein [Burkholderia sp. R-70006]CAE6792908.1 hypothetical protein R70006_04930 [Paraburkholderia domus]
MTEDLFEQLSATRLRTIESAQRDGATGFYLPDHRWEEPVYLLDGAKVTKEEFILRSGLEHLLPDVSAVKCSRCGREESPAQWHKRCGMPQPGSVACDGVFF